MLAAMDSGTKQQVYVQLLGEGTVVYRPAMAIHQEDEIYRLSATQGYDPEDEHWEFPPGSLVRCEERSLQEGRCLVAFALVEERSKGQKD